MRRPLILGVVALALVVGAVTWWVARPATYEAEPPPASPSISRAEAAAVVGRFAEAVARGDVRAAQRLAPAGDAEARAWLADVVRNVADLDLHDVTMRFIDSRAGARSSTDAEAQVALGWVDADGAPARMETALALVGTDNGVAVAAIADNAAAPVWLTGAVDVRRMPRLEVVRGVSAPGPSLARLVALGREARSAVARVLPAWRGELVIEVPESAAGLDRALGAEDGTYAAIAAVTSSADGQATSQAAVHVFLNPEVFSRLGPRGAQIVLSHEAAHVATGATTRPGPSWLTEGFADYVALRDVDLPLATTAGQVRRQVRRDGVPARLPDDAAFDPRATHLGATYEAAWLACRTIVRLSDEQSLIAVYDQVRGGTDLETALRAQGVGGVGALTAAWQRELQRLAG